MAKLEHLDGPVAQLNLLGAIIDDERCRLIHIKAAKHIISRYWSKFGNARAGVGFLESATGLTRGSVAQASADLVDWGYFTRRMGSGKRPTEYVPIWRSVLQPQDATSVLQPQDACVLQPQDAKSGSVLQPQDQTCLPVPAYKAGLRDKQDIDPAAPSAPLADALGGTAAETAGFDELYEAYAVRTKRAAARAAYDKLAPGAELHRAMVGAAGAWRQAYDEHGREVQYRKQLATWLAGECWLEDPPIDPVDHKPKASKPRVPRADAPPADAPYLAKMVDVELDDDEDSQIVTVTFRPFAAGEDEDENDWKTYFNFADPIDIGRFNDLAAAVGIAEVTRETDTDEFLFKPLLVIPRAESWNLFAPANDASPTRPTPTAMEQA